MIEQGNVTTQVNSTGGANTFNTAYSFYDQNNLPSPPAVAPGSNAGLASIEVFQCPSAPLRSTNYEAYLVSQGLTTNTTATCPLGYIDYGAFRGWDASVNLCYPVAASLLPGQSATTSGDVALLAPIGSVTSGVNLARKIHITDMTDGSSNTVLVGESAGKQQIYELEPPSCRIPRDRRAFTRTPAGQITAPRSKVYGFNQAGPTAGGCSVMNATDAPVESGYFQFAANAGLGDLFVPYGRSQLPPWRWIGGIYHHLTAAERYLPL